MTARERYEQFCGFLGVEPEWPENPQGSDRAVARAWEQLDAAIDEEVKRGVEQIVARRESADEADLALQAARAQAFDPEG